MSKNGFYIHRRSDKIIIYNQFSRQTFICENTKQINKEEIYLKVADKIKDAPQKNNILNMKKTIFKGITNKNNQIISFLYWMILLAWIPLLLTDFFFLINVNIGSQVRRSVSEYVGVKFILYLVIEFIISIWLHEVAHIIFALHNDLLVGEVGVMLYYFIPCAYTTICGMSLVKTKLSKIFILISGSLMNLILAEISLIFILNGYDSIYALSFAGINIISIVFNLLIFLKLDGYYILEILLNINNLREHSFDFLKQKNYHIFNYSMREKTYVVYSVFSILYLITLVASFVMVIWEIR